MLNLVASCARLSHRTRLVKAIAPALAAVVCFGSVEDGASAQQRSAKREQSWAARAAPSGYVGAYLAARQAESRRDFKAAARYFRRAMRAQPRDVRVVGAALRYSLLAGDVRAAITVAEWITLNKINSPQAVLVAAVEEIREGRFAEARRMLEKQGDRITPVLRDLLIGWSAYGAGDTEAAFKAFAANPAMRGKPIFGAQHEGRLALMLGDAPRALAAFEASHKALGGWPRDLALIAAAAHQAAGDKAKARDVLNLALKSAPFDEIVLAALARVAADKPVLPSMRSAKEGAAAALVSVARAVGGRRRESAELSLAYAQLAHALAPEYELANIVIGQRLGDLRQYRLAASAYARTPKSSIYSMEARFGRALALSRLNDLPGAIAQTKELLAEGARSPDLYLALGNFASREKLYGECAESYEKGIARMKEVLSAIPASNWSFYFNAGICRERSKQWDKAEAHFKAALALKPGQPDVLNYYGYSLVEQRRRLGEARDMIKRAIAAKPKSGHIVDSLGWVMWRTGDFEGAVRELARAIAMEPAISEINDHYGDALWMVGRKREARFHWRRALTFKPDTKAAETRIQRKLKLGLDAVLSEEGYTPVKAIEDSSAPPSAKPSGERAPNGG
ncbi:MAG: tetratricopeptide repeat protein [Neomegalonema sp.]|nr:tetratricopeptide repeat protein [Neomegalonema sp.]